MQAARVAAMSKLREPELPIELFRSGDHGPSLVAGDGSSRYSPLQQVRLAAGEVVGTATSARQVVIDRVLAGELVELDVDIRAFQQIEGVPNANFLRFKKGIVRKLAKSFKGQVFLRDHNDLDLDARGGTITKAQAVPIDGGIGFDFTIRMAAPWAVLGVMRGTLDRFSIGWAHGGRDTILCSHCMCPVFAECFHFPGDKIENEETGDVTLVEWVFTVAEGTEASAVSIPAVPGTHINEVRAALSATAKLCRERQTGTMQQEDDSMDLKAIAKKLGLAEDATPETILAALDAAQQAQAEAGAELTALRGSQQEMQTQITDLAARDQQRTVDGLFVEFADRLPKARDAEGKLCAHPAEVELRKLAATDAASARAILSTMPVLRPDGTLQSVPGHDDPLATEDRPAVLPAGAGWDPVLKSQLDDLDITPEEYAEFGPHAGPALSVKAIQRQERARRAGTRTVH